jgi:hypothetical protein
MNDLKLEDFLDQVVSAINRDRSLGDEVDVQEIEQSGLYGVRVKLTNGQSFLVRVGLDP